MINTTDLIKDIWARYNSTYNNSALFSEEQTEMAERVLKDVQKAVEYFDCENKYKWHDLRKNPNDMPTEDMNGETDYVLCLCGDSKWNHWEQCYYNYNKKMWSSCTQNVIAWKEIEPFESEVE